MWEASKVYEVLLKFEIHCSDDLLVFSDWLEDQHQMEWAIVCRYLRVRRKPEDYNFIECISDNSWRRNWPQKGIQRWLKENWVTENLSEFGDIASLTRKER